MAGKDNIFLCDRNLDFRNPDIAGFHQYWSAKQSGREFPSREDIVPREITRLLPWLHMHDVPPAGAEIHIRLIGTMLSEVFGDGNMRGKPLSALPAGVHARVKQAIHWVMEARAPIRTYAPHAALPKRRFYGIESCFAPLSGNGRDINMIIAVSILENWE